jgi:hypothetical protein
MGAAAGLSSSAESTIGQIDPWHPAKTCESRLPAGWTLRMTETIWKSLMHDDVLAEEWHGGGAQMPSCGGAVGMWRYQSVLGIRPDPRGPGFKRFILAPQPDPATGLTEAQGWYDSTHGRIESRWKIAHGKIQMHAVIPANTLATVRAPTTKPANSPPKEGPSRADP